MDYISHFGKRLVSFIIEVYTIRIGVNTMKLTYLKISIIIILLLLNICCSTSEEFSILSEVEGPIKTNCYLLYSKTTKVAAIFDVGGPLDTLSIYIKENNLKLKYIFLTHGHWDHVEGILNLKDRFPDAKLCFTKIEETAMQNYFSFALESDPARFTEAMKDSALSKMISFDLTSIGEPDIYLKDNQVYKLGKLKIKTIFSPGHSKGSMCYYVGNVLLSGDVLLYRSVGNTDFYGASRADQIKSVRRLYSILPENTMVYPGHGKFTDIGSEKKKNKNITVDGGQWFIQ